MIDPLAIATRGYRPRNGRSRLSVATRGYRLTVFVLPGDGGVWAVVVARGGHGVSTRRAVSLALVAMALPDAQGATVSDAEGQTLNALNRDAHPDAAGCYPRSEDP